MKKAGRILALLVGLGIIVGAAARAEAGENTGSRGAVQFQGVGGTVQILFHVFCRGRVSRGIGGADMASCSV